MVVNVCVVAGAKRDTIVEEASGLKVYLRAPAVEGKANAALREALAAHFAVAASQVRIVQGERARIKLVEIDGV